MDGHFPSELQRHYAHGYVLQVSSAKPQSLRRNCSLSSQDNWSSFFHEPAAYSPQQTNFDVSEQTIRSVILCTQGWRQGGWEHTCSSCYRK